MTVASAVLLVAMAAQTSLSAIVIIGAILWFALNFFQAALLRSVHTENLSTTPTKSPRKPGLTVSIKPIRCSHAATALQFGRGK
jgi:hypothetical protein